MVPEGHGEDQAPRAELCADFCRGAIIGIYDAEDAPEPDQIRKVVRTFRNARRPRSPACRACSTSTTPAPTGSSRCFTIEYAGWFRLVLPGIARLGLVVPLGGTTLFFRRDVLERLGGWDAHNVTEDADLGIRLARHGYRTELIDTVTEEEANCRALPWIKQRSRWIKGYMMTWAVHMRDPGCCGAQLGPARLHRLPGPVPRHPRAIPAGAAGVVASAGALRACRIRCCRPCRRRPSGAWPRLFLLSEVVNLAVGIDRPPPDASTGLSLLMGADAEALLPAGRAGRLQGAVSNW